MTYRALVVASLIPHESIWTKAVNCGWSIFFSLGKNPESWAKGLKQEDFELLCLDGTRKPVTEAQSCHLARVPNHAVFSRKDKVDFARRILFNQQVWAPVPTSYDSVPVPRAVLTPCTHTQPSSYSFSLRREPWASSSCLCLYLMPIYSVAL